MVNVLRATVVEMIADADPSTRWQSFWLEVTGPGEVASVPGGRKCVPQFQMMCDEITSDIQHPEGSGAATLQTLNRVEQGLSDLEELSGNAWYTYIAKNKVWFEGLYEQGEGGEVSFEQYKVAVQTYVRFLQDPEHKPIEVELPRFIEN